MKRAKKTEQKVAPSRSSSIRRLKRSLEKSQVPAESEQRALPSDPTPERTYYIYHKRAGEEYPAKGQAFSHLPRKLSKLRHSRFVPASARGFVLLTDDWPFLRALDGQMSRVVRHIRLKLDRSPSDPELKKIITAGKQDMDGLHILALRAVVAKDAEFDVTVSGRMLGRLYRVFRRLDFSIVDFYCYAVGRCDLEVLGLKSGEVRAVTAGEILSPSAGPEADSVLGDFNPGLFRQRKT